MLFRDDIVFFIFLYQKYIYKEDPTRVNEFGYSAEMIEDNGNAEKIVSDENTEGKENPAVDETIEDKSVGAKKDD